jgi:hypothetical protein
MKIIITGTRGLAAELGNAYRDQFVTLISKSGGYDINDVDQWSHIFYDHDVLFNCAYSEFSQVRVLELFYQAWQQDPNKTIVSIGSKVVSGARAEINTDNAYWPYRLHKQTLQTAHDTMSRTAKCNMKIINPGPVDTDMISHVDCVKMDPAELAAKIRNWVDDPYVKRVDLWP